MKYTVGKIVYCDGLGEAKVVFKKWFLDWDKIIIADICSDAIWGIGNLKEEQLNDMSPVLRAAFGYEDDDDASGISEISEGSSGQAGDA